MSQVTLTPIPVDGGSIVDLSTAGYCQMGNGQYFVVYGQVNPNHVFGCLYTVAGEETDNPSITIQRTQSIAGIAPSLTTESSLSYKVAKLNDDTVVVLVQAGGTANVYPVRIDSNDNYNMYQVDEEYSIPSIMDPQYAHAMFEQISENTVAFGWGEYKSDDNYTYCRLNKISFNDTNDTMSVLSMSVPDSGRFVNNDNRRYATVNLTELKDQPGTFFITYSHARNSNTWENNAHMIFRSNFSGSQVYDQMGASGSPGDTDLSDLAGALPIAYSISDWYMVGEGVAYVRGYGSSSNQVTSELNFANDLSRHYQHGSRYLQWHQLGNDDEKTMIYIHENHGTGSSTDSQTDELYRNPYQWGLRVLKPGPSNTLICSPATSNVITFSTPSVTPMTTQPESFFKLSESTICMVGVKNRNANASHEIVMCYIKF